MGPHSISSHSSASPLPGVGPESEQAAAVVTFMRLKECVDAANTQICFPVDLLASSVGPVVDDRVGQLEGASAAFVRSRDV